MKTNTSNDELEYIKEAEEHLRKAHYSRIQIIARMKKMQDRLIRISKAREQGYAKALDDVEKIIDKNEDLCQCGILEIIKQEIAKLHGIPVQKETK